MGHSIPSEDQTAIVEQLRAVCATPILAMRRPNDAPLKAAEHNLDSGDPDRFLTYVKKITKNLEHVRALA
jgi:hypothetical protein